MYAIRSYYESRVKNLFMKKTKIFVCVIILLSATSNLFSQNGVIGVTANFKKQFAELLGNEFRYNEVKDMTSQLQKIVRQEKEECNFPYISVITSYSIHYTKLYDVSVIL